MHCQNFHLLGLVVLIVTVILCTNQEALARPQAASPSIGGSASGGSNVDAGSPSGAGATATIQSSGGGPGASISIDASTGASTGGSMSDASAHVSAQMGSTTSKPEGLFGKVKDMFNMGDKKDEKKEDKKITVETSATANGGSPSSGQDSANVGSQISADNQSSSKSDSSTTPRPEGILERTAEKMGEKASRMGEKVADKVVDAAKKGKEIIKDVTEPLREGKRSDEGASKSGDKKEETSMKKEGDSRDGEKKESEKKDDSSLKKDGERKDDSSMKKEGERKEDLESKKDGERKDDSGTKKGEERKDDSSMKKDGERKDDSASRKDGDRKDDSIMSKDHGDEKKEGPVDKFTKFMSKGTEIMRDTVHKVEDKAHDIGDRVAKVVDENITKPMQATSGSGEGTSQGKLTPSAAAVARLKGSEKEKYLVEEKRKQEAEISRPSSLKDVVLEAKNRGIIPKNEDRSVLRGNHDDEKSVAVEVFDRAHEISKIPVETVLKPIDKILGYEKDPLLRVYDNSHEILRKPLSLVAKPVESVLTGAFKTTDEAKKDSEKLLSTTSEQERKEARKAEERARKEDRSVVGEIADKTLELATKPIEIVLKPFDHVLGFDRDGKKNPLLRLMDEIYGLSKKPVDSVAKPFERVLKKMGQNDQMYQVSLRMNSDGSDPKLVTRLADGALNIADRVLTKPLEIVLMPLDHALGYDEPGKKNPVLEAAHSLKNATKLGVELFTRPIDRIIKEISDIGDSSMSEAEHEENYKLQREDASRIVMALDKLHDVAQFPFEIVLRPVGKVLGTYKEGKKGPFLRSWDIIHQVLRTPIQVVSKPVEDAILGERTRKHKSRAQIKSEVQSDIRYHNGHHDRKNYLTDGIKKIEKFAVKPVEVVTFPVRKLILGEDNDKVGTRTEKINRDIQSKAKNGSDSSEMDPKTGTGDNQRNYEKEDKIMVALDKINNVMLKPLELMTQPISDTLFSEGDKDKNKSDMRSSNSAFNSASTTASPSASEQSRSSGSSNNTSMKKN